jgi:hypothetical protein
LPRDRVLSSRSIGWHRCCHILGRWSSQLLIRLACVTLSGTAVSPQSKMGPPLKSMWVKDWRSVLSNMRSGVFGVVSSLKRRLICQLKYFSAKRMFESPESQEFLSLIRSFWSDSLSDYGRMLNSFSVALKAESSLWQIRTCLVEIVGLSPHMHFKPRPWPSNLLPVSHFTIFSVLCLTMDLRWCQWFCFDLFCRSNSVIEASKPTRW